MMEIIKKENIKVTFFTTGSALLDTSANFTNVYKEMLSLGHQVALHSHTHPKLENLSATQISNELSQNIAAMSSKLGISSKYFRAPYGTDGALTRERVEAAVGGGSHVINCNPRPSSRTPCVLLTNNQGAWT